MRHQAKVAADIVTAVTYPVFVEIFARGYPARKAASLHPIGAMRYE